MSRPESEEAAGRSAGARRPEPGARRWRQALPVTALGVARAGPAPVQRPAPAKLPAGWMDVLRGCPAGGVHQTAYIRRVQAGRVYQGASGDDQRRLLSRPVGDGGRSVTTGEISTGGRRPAPRPASTTTVTVSTYRPPPTMPPPPTTMPAVFVRGLMDGPSGIMSLNR